MSLLSISSLLTQPGNNSDAELWSESPIRGFLCS